MICSTADAPGKIQMIPTLGLDRKTLEEAVDDVSNPSQVRKELTNCTYLQDSSTEIYGLKIYGTPWQPKFCGWAFNLERGQELCEKWDKIPEDTDVLITHTPPVGYGDLCSTGIRAGCVDLLMSVQQRVKPKYHIYGHIHEGIKRFDCRNFDSKKHFEPHGRIMLNEYHQNSRLWCSI